MPSLSSLLPYARIAAPVAAGVINRRAAGTATRDLTSGINAATGTIQAGSESARRTMADVYAEQQRLLAPYTTAGQPATQRLTEGVAPGGSLVKPFDAATFDLYKDPSYQWRVQQGNRAIEAGANAAGTRFTPSTLKVLTDYNQSEGSKEYAAADQRFQQDQQKEYDRLMGVSNIGQNAANQAVAAGGTYGSNLSRVQQSTAAQVADLQTDLASAQAAGDVAKVNTLTDLIDKVSSGFSLASAAPGVTGAASAGIPAISSIVGPAAASTASLASAATPSLAAIAGGAVPEIPLGATIGGNIALGGSTAGGLAGTAGGGTAAGGSGGLSATLSALATNPLTWVAAGAIGGALLLHHYVGQGRKQADVLTHPSTGPDDPGGLQWGFEQTLKTIDATPNQSDAQKWAAKTQAYGQLEKFGLDFAAKGKNQRKAASQMFDTVSHLFGSPNPLRAAV